MHLDPWIFTAGLSLITLGLLMVTSASMVISERQFNYPFHFLFHQGAYLVLGVILGVAAFRVSLEQWRIIGTYLFVICLLLLILVLVPGIGHKVNGSTRWLGFGPLTLQVSELTKFSVILYLGGYLVRRDEEIKTSLFGFLKPLFLLGIISILLLLEPDFGATTVILLTSLGVMFLAKVRIWQFSALFLMVAVALVVLAVSSPYRLQRITTFLHPWENPYDSGYQLTQSLIAFGRGGLFGVGLGNSIQKLFYLPEAQTDFLFAVLAEELGFLGECLVIVLFIMLVGRAMRIGKQAMLQEKSFEAYVAFGFGLWLGIQALINMGVSSGLLPTKGLTLPLMSYGGNSLLINCVVLAILLRISHDCRASKTQVIRKKIVRHKV
ncbi:MAG: putative lipid II flippase FtsW [Gammaproteobacteria bacterium]|nr:putative lipid II flippase FtsW [Gammaproteobacteria bacterium]